MNKKISMISRLSALTLIMLAVTGCNTITRLTQVGDGPTITPIVNPKDRPDYRKISMPMPPPQAAERNPNSLWRTGARAFFKDNRANEVGDILTVMVNMADSASFSNKTSRKRQDSEDTDVTALLGLESQFAKKLPEAVNPSSMISFGNNHNTAGTGSIDRSEEISFSVAAVITQILPNGNLVIAGRQETRVNFELREVMITGIVRPEDIDTANSISHDKIAEMRMAYGGRGNVSELQQPRWGTQIWDILFPF
ncbi:MAG: flagellar basal body L-ring protein FlgH [Rhodospirillales bacterium]|nr:flagellar basal body L-ring protein FlgH [Rhodospirillales bacterium]MCW8951151.1 flagellar basal body L-ring protein FlgH [Rhodospirillales bacterium]MCW8969993.1 flagellar basal body L-ring protein FlgH [Rhodospirillales bacterium]MCW9001879.1 flagellar basal body L-ring protein FlgH [Rhodospirillales bacterium]MCW9038979.1 flagellar basal body L-ring protein FlgH [Rhodospirillales bacterium]